MSGSDRIAHDNPTSGVLVNAPRHRAIGERGRSRRCRDNCGRPRGGRLAGPLGVGVGGYHPQEPADVLRSRRVGSRYGAGDVLPDTSVGEARPLPLPGDAHDAAVGVGQRGRERGSSRRRRRHRHGAGLVNVVDVDGDLDDVIHHGVGVAFGVLVIGHAHRDRVERLHLEVQIRCCGDAELARARVNIERRRIIAIQRIRERVAVGIVGFDRLSHGHSTSGVLVNAPRHHAIGEGGRSRRRHDGRGRPRGGRLAGPQGIRVRGYRPQEPADLMGSRRVGIGFGAGDVLPDISHDQARPLPLPGDAHDAAVGVRQRGRERGSSRRRACRDRHAAVVVNVVDVDGDHDDAVHRGVGVAFGVLVIGHAHRDRVERLRLEVQHGVGGDADLARARVNRERRRIIAIQRVGERVAVGIVGFDRLFHGHSTSGVLVDASRHHAVGEGGRSRRRRDGDSRPRDGRLAGPLAVRVRGHRPQEPADLMGSRRVGSRFGVRNVLPDVKHGQARPLPLPGDARDAAVGVGQRGRKRGSSRRRACRDRHATGLVNVVDVDGDSGGVVHRGVDVAFGVLAIGHAHRDRVRLPELVVQQRAGGDANLARARVNRER